MAYNLLLAKRIREALDALPGLQEKKMFGGVGYILRGNMACGVLGDDLIVRIGLDEYKRALKQPFTKPFDAYGKLMAGWIMVAAAGTENDEDLKTWVWRGVDFARTLPEK
jgi:TfoX/Sxy family transcriptional regulator of competence genes